MPIDAPAPLDASAAPPARKAGVAQGIVIVIAGFLPILAIVSLAPAVPSLMGHFAGLPNATTIVPLMITAPGLLIALASPGMGWLVDRVGRRWPLVIATLVYAVLGVAPLVLTSLQGIFACRLGLGLCEAVILTAANTLLGDYYPADARRLWLTVQGVVGTVLGTATVMAGGALSAAAWNGAFAIYGVAFLIFLAMAAFVYEPPRVRAELHDPAGSHGPFPWGPVMAFSGATLFAAILYYVGIVQFGLAFGAVGVSSPRTLGLIISLISIGVPVGTLMFGVLSKRLGRASLVGLSLAMMGAGVTGIGLSHGYRLAMVFGFVQQMGAGMTVPTLVFWATGVLDVRHRGRGMGFWSSAFFLGQFVSPIVVGAVRGLVGGAILPAFVVLGVAGLAGSAAAFALGVRARADARR